MAALPASRAQPHSHLQPTSLKALAEDGGHQAGSSLPTPCRTAPTKSCPSPHLLSDRFPARLWRRSWNHRTVWLGGDLKDHRFPAQPVAPFQPNLLKPHFFPQTQPCQTHQPAPRTCSNQFQEGDVLLQEGQRLGKHKEPPAPADSQLFHLEIGGARLSWQQSGRCIAGREPGRKHSSPLVVHFPKPTGCVPK